MRFYRNVYLPVKKQFYKQINHSTNLEKFPLTNSENICILTNAFPKEDDLQKGTLFGKDRGG